MMTSRSEYRLVLRQDNADWRMMPIGRRIGLLPEERYRAMCEKYAHVEAEIKRLERTNLAPSEGLNAVLAAKGTAPLQTGCKAADLVRRPQIGYADFAAFTLKGNVLFREGFSASVWLLVLIAFIALALIIILNAKTYKKPLNILAIIVMLAIIPFGNNIIFLFSDSIEYHLLMRMQWVLYFIWAVVLADIVIDKTDLKNIELKKEKNSKNAIVFFFTVLTAVSLGFYIYGNIVVANICYYNMNESYEKTYGYLVRLIDRMEQTEGYYPGMKVAMVGVVSKESYPETNITLDITGNIRGTNQTIIPYKAEMYANFMSHYMNYELNYLEGEELEEVYYSDEYQELESFPSVNSMRVVNDTLYIKLE
jgi:hypothetical protein